MAVDSGASPERCAAATDGVAGDDPSVHNQRVWRSVCIVLTGFICATLFHYHFGDRYPFNTFLFDPTDSGNDFFNILNASRDLNPYSNHLAVYFPFTYIPMWLLGKMPSAFAFWVFVVGFIAAALHLAYRSLRLPRYERAAAALTLTFLTYPFLFCLDRANMECFVFIFLCLFFYYFDRESPLVAAAWLSCATAMKLYPGVFALLFLLRRQYRAFWTAVAVTLSLTLFSAALFPGGVLGSLRRFESNLAWFNENYALGVDGLRYSSSYFGLLRMLVVLVAPPIAAHQDRLLFPYTIACVAAFGAITWVLFRRPMPRWKQLLLLTFPVILFPQVSFDYKLVHCAFPFFAFLSSRDADARDGDYALLFAVLLIPKAYLWIDGDINIGVILNPLIMTALMVLVLRHRTPVLSA